MLKHLCPCCGRHCYLDDPKCERGAQYAETGVIPPRKPRPEGHPGGRKPSEQKMRYLAMDREEKITFNLQNMGNTLQSLGDTVTPGELLDCLRDEDRADLLMLLEKLKHAWHHRYNQNTV